MYLHVILGKSEIVLTEAPKHLRRKVDAEMGLALIDLG
jgi:hypothetical protein